MFVFRSTFSQYVSVTGSLSYFFSAKQALRGAEGRQKDLEAEVERVMQQKEEEVNRVKEGLEEQQERQLAEAKAREENSRYASKFTWSLHRNNLSLSPRFLYSPFFLDLTESCWRCRRALHKKMRR